MDLLWAIRKTAPIFSFNLLKTREGFLFCQSKSQCLLLKFSLYIRKWQLDKDVLLPLL